MSPFSSLVSRRGGGSRGGRGGSGSFGGRERSPYAGEGILNFGPGEWSSWPFPYTDQDGNPRLPRTHAEGIQSLIQYAERPGGNQARDPSGSPVAINSFSLARRVWTGANLFRSVSDSRVSLAAVVAIHPPRPLPATDIIDLTDDRSVVRSAQGLSRRAYQRPRADSEVQEITIVDLTEEEDNRRRTEPSQLA
ncbi:Major facilitator superfamily domain general substrate transporter [Penicillium atrosanguineum]|uniref:Major facilitator superfamily domain general substrate transporter n=1 Tax=Penicillium atrosanguineum TaxID=1132637 RepID=UPI002395A5B4|nr:Major facilitator superfamily domain general substrate transporter [Penicillium atrosanguineum]KAJ5309353.1 Major facilitator superfamily domain general substrate transporter [Penicillium atrosanguineum]